MLSARAKLNRCALATRYQTVSALEGNFLPQRHFNGMFTTKHTRMVPCAEEGYPVAPVKHKDRYCSTMIARKKDTVRFSGMCVCRWTDWTVICNSDCGHNSGGVFVCVFGRKDRR